MRTERLRALALGVVFLGAGLAIGMARSDHENLPFGQEVTIVFRRDTVGASPVLPHRGGQQIAEGTNLTGVLTSADESWLCIRTERFAGGAVKPVVDEVWVARDSVLLLVRD